MKVKVTQSCLTLYNTMDCILPGFSVHGILQAKILEWVAYSFSRGSSHPGMEPRSPALQVHSLLSEPPGQPKNTGVSSLSLPSLEDLPDREIELGSPALQTDSLPTELSGKPQKTVKRARNYSLPSIYTFRKHPPTLTLVWFCDSL